jgi:hypothetical protein
MLLDAFQEDNWPDYIDNPFKDEFKFQQTIKDFNNRLPMGCPFRLRRENSRVYWEFRTDAS